jgi:hypothetical protein
MNIRSGLTGLAVTAAALAALSTPVREASSTAAVAPAPAQEPAVLISTQVSSENQLMLPIVEAHSDGGYSYWHQAEIRLPIQAAVRTAPPKL